MKAILSFFLLLTPLFASDPLLDRNAHSSFNKLISEEEIDTRMHEVAASIDEAFQEKEIAIIMLMKGAICVTSDLMRALHTPTTLDFIQTSSYGANGTTRGELTILGLDKLDLDGKNVLVIDDIYDSGATLEKVVQKIAEKNPGSIHSFVFLKKNIPHQVDYQPDFVGFEIEDLFVVGYGMDYKEYWRDLPAIYSVE